MLFNCCDKCGTLHALKNRLGSSRDINADITSDTYRCPNCCREVVILKKETQEEFMIRIRG